MGSMQPCIEIASDGTRVNGLAYALRTDRQASSLRGRACLLAGGLLGRVNLGYRRDGDDRDAGGRGIM